MLVRLEGYVPGPNWTLTVLKLQYKENGHVNLTFKDGNVMRVTDMGTIKRGPVDWHWGVRLGATWIFIPNPYEDLGDCFQSWIHSGEAYLERPTLTELKRELEAYLYIALVGQRDRGEED